MELKRVIPGLKALDFSKASFLLPLFFQNMKNIISIRLLYGKKTHKNNNRKLRPLQPLDSTYTLGVEFLFFPL